MKYETTVKAVNRVLKSYTGTLTLRQIYYQLVSRYNLPNKQTSYNALSATLVKAREREEVDDTRIEDRSRQTLGGDFGFDSPEDYIDSKIQAFASNNYTRRMWQDQPQYVEVWVEKDALSRVVSEAVSGLRVVTAPSRGYSSYTYLKRMAIDERFSEVEEGKPITVLDFRDHDPSGIQMTEDLQTRLSRYALPGMEITVKRIALTYDQVQQYRLTPNPVKGADPRARDYYAKYGRTCWELDAIPPDELKRLVKNAVLAEIDSDIWEESRERARTEFDEVAIKLTQLASSLTGAAP